MYLGSHLSIAKGFEKAGKTAVDIGANTFQFFTRNPRGGKAKEIDEIDVNKLELLMKDNKFGPLLAHAPYTLNLASAKEDVRIFGKSMIKDDLKRLEVLPCNLYNFHPGSHVGQGVEEGSLLIAETLNEVMTENMSTIVLLETMAGKGSEIGSTFEELKRIIDLVQYKDKIGVCLDTCHVFDAGYDIKNDFDKVMEEFDQVIGLDLLKAIHLNDSKFGLSSHKDRHAGMNEGLIGMDTIIQILQKDYLRDLPFFLETPYDDLGHKKEIEMIRDMIK